MSSVHERNRKVFDVGINDADYVVTGKDKVTGKQLMCPYYSRWRKMLTRCYFKKYQEKQPTYKNCSVCDEWLTFSNFKRWMEQQDWEGKQLDKDFIVPDNKQYSPETCVFMSGSLNKFTVTSGKAKGCYPLGVSWCKQRCKFQANVGDGYGKVKHLGRFTTQQEAHKAWQQGKIEIGYALLQEQTDPRITTALERILTKLEHELDNNTETLSLTGSISTTQLEANTYE